MTRRSTSVAILSCMLVLIGMTPVVSQESDTTDRQIVSVAFDMIDLRAGSLEVSAGLRLADFLTLLLEWEVGYRTVGEEPATELGLGIATSAELFSQEDGLPVTVSLDGRFQKSRYVGSWLDTQELMRSGTNYTLGGEVSRLFPLGEAWAISAVLLGGFAFDNEITEERPGAGTGFVTTLDTCTDYRIGIAVAAEYHIADLARLRMGLRGRIDRDLHIVYGPLLMFSTE